MSNALRLKDPNGDLLIGLELEDEGVWITISKAGFVIYRLFLEDIRLQHDKEKLARLSERPAEGFFSIETQLQIIKRVEREMRRRS